MGAGIDGVLDFITDECMRSGHFPDRACGPTCARLLVPAQLALARAREVAEREVTVSARPDRGRGPRSSR